MEFDDVVLRVGDSTAHEASHRSIRLGASFTLLESCRAYALLEVLVSDLSKAAELWPTVY
jgi:hypothetical protein